MLHEVKYFKKLNFSMSVEICFDGYLRSLISAEQQWWRLYALTNATGRESELNRVKPSKPYIQQDTESQKNAC